jgi:hypothetical protein
MDVLSGDVLNIILGYFQGNPNYFIIRRVCKEWSKILKRQKSSIEDVIKYNTLNRYLDILKWIQESHPIRYFIIYNFAKSSSVLDSNICVYAAKTGDMKTLEWALTIGCDLFEDVFDAAAQGGHVKTLNWLLNQECPWKLSIWESAASSKNSDTFTWLQQNMPVDGFNSEKCQIAAAKEGNLELLKLLKKDDMDSENLVNAALLGGNSEMIEWLLPFHAFTVSTIATACLVGNLEIVKRELTNPSQLHHSYCKNAALNGHFELLQWLHAFGCPWNETATAAAVSGEHFEILKWLVEKDCTMHFITSTAAVIRGRFDILTWALDNGCPMNEYNCIESAAEHGHLKILDWLWPRQDWGLHVATMIMNFAAQRGDLEMLRWGKKRFLSCTKSIYMEAAINGQLEAIKWLLRNRYPSDSSFSNSAAQRGHLKLVRWLVENEIKSGAEADQALQFGQLRVLKYLKSKGIWSKTVDNLAKQKWNSF